MELTSTAIIKHFCEKNNGVLTEKQEKDFLLLTKELLAYNEHTNLTAVRDEDGVMIKHHADSIAPLFFDDAASLFPVGARVIDVGCGAGFPGLPLKIMRPDLAVTFLDSTEKKLRFTSLVAEKLGFTALCLPKRAEDAVKAVKPDGKGTLTPEDDGGCREVFDTAVSRAMANLPVLCELALPFVKKGGVFLAYKSLSSADTSDPESELSKAKSAIGLLGGKLRKVYEVDLRDYFPPEEQNDDKRHCVIVIDKVGKTPAAYPRRYAQIVKKPL